MKRSAIFFVAIALVILSPFALGFWIGHNTGQSHTGNSSWFSTANGNSNAQFASFHQNGSGADNVDSAGTRIDHSRRNAITEAVAQASPAIVGINVTAIQEVQYQNPWLQMFPSDPFFKQYFGNQTYRQEVKSLGSGFIISPDGYIITNDHVAGNGKTITVTLTNKEQYQAKIVGTDRATDICLLKIEGHNLPYMRLGSSDDLIIGEWVIALGNPFGLFEISDKPTVTVGVISAIGMNIRADQDRYYRNMIQTDAAINSGNSGGPLVNALGEVIGVNAVIFSPNQGSVGVGFAIPISRVKKVLDELRNTGTVDRNFWTGIDINSIDQRVARYFGLDNTQGVIISDVKKNSPGERAGFKVGDIIIAVNEEKIITEEDITSIVSQAKTGDILQVRIIRDKKQMTVPLALEKTKS